VAQGQQTSPTRQAPRVPARQFAIDAARMLADTRCHNVAILDVSGLSPVTDFMVIATGTSPRQMRTACDEAEELGEPMGHRALSRSEDSTGSWILIDFVDVVVHVFNQESRMFYDLDGLWGDAPRVTWEREEREAARGAGQATVPAS
jgi:ribosome-associated protein